MPAGTTTVLTSITSFAGMTCIVGRSWRRTRRATRRSRSSACRGSIFTFEPWSRVVYRPDPQRSGRPKVLFCTNFGTAYFWKLPREQADKLFAPWKDRIRIYSDYWRSIEAQWNSREHAFDFLNALVEADKYEILLRPHPMEETTIYEKWLNTLPPSRRQHIRMDATSNITPLILDCDLQISCETCTTALESWIAGKPTVELLFDRDQLWYFEEPARGNFPCDDPGRLVQLVEKGLHEPLPPEMAEARRNHLEKWCSTPDGTSSEHIADIVAKALHGKEAADWSRLTVNDYRRSIKLQGLRSLGLAYHFDPLLPFKRTVFPSRYSVKGLDVQEVDQAARRGECAPATGVETWLLSRVDRRREPDDLRGPLFHESFGRLSAE